MTRLYKFVLPMPPTRGNARGFSKWANTDRKKYWNNCDLLMHGQGFFPFREEPLARAQWKAEFFVSNASHLMDFDNMVAKLKWPIDYLKARNIIVDDAHNKLWPNWLPEQAVIKGQTPSLHLTLTEVE